MWVDPKSSAMCPYESKKREVSQREGEATQRRQPHEDEGRDRGDAAASQGMPGASRSWKRQGQTPLPARAFRDSMVLPHLDLRLLACST